MHKRCEINKERQRTMRSIEEEIEYTAKNALNKIGVKPFNKTEPINDEIENALKSYPSKKGGTGGNAPDIKVFIDKLPVMIEVKGAKGNLAKINAVGEIDNFNRDGTPNYANISQYAVNGAVHYAQAIINLSKSYKSALAIGINGFEQNGKIETEYGVYYVSKDNGGAPQKIDDYTDLSFLAAANRKELLNKIKEINLTEEEKERKNQMLENDFEDKLKKLNQKMHDILGISVGQRVGLIVGLIMAGLGVDENEVKVDPLEISDLKGQTGADSTDGNIIISKITSFLKNKKLPDDKTSMIVNELTKIFIYSDLWKPQNGESVLKKVYIDVKKDILPLLQSQNKHLDFAGKLFNVLNDWVAVPDGAKNDVVLTPRYITEFMAKLACVNKDSYVWDYALGSAGFLISAMKLMLQDAENIKSSEERRKKICKIKSEQLLGIEKLPDVYLLAVLNMILMGDGSTNILHKDSLKDFSGNYEQGYNKGKPFPATVFLLNPPYSAKGKGLIFVDKALSKMKNGRACVLIQENAGSTQGEGFPEKILKNNTLIASIHMADIFCGKAGVQTAVYVFDVGTPHDAKKLVKFIDFSNDGYARQNRKKSSASVNLRDVGNAKERYREAVDIVLGNKKETDYLADCVIEDTISLKGNDWTYSQHKKIDTAATEEDFKNTVKNYLSWKVSTLLKEEKANFQ